MNEQMRKAVVPAIVGVSGLSVGGVLGYILGRRKTKQEFYETAVALDNHIMSQDREINVLKGSLRERFDERLAKVLETPMTDKVNYDLMVDGTKVDEVEEQDEDNIVNVFNNEIPGWDWEAELNSRSNKTIYVISKEEFFADDMGYRQSTVTWYAGDRTLADEREQPIYNWSSLIGTELPFGHGSSDDNVVYIRNEELRHEWEICQDPSAHGIEVAGFELEQDYEEQDIRHSVSPLKFRRE